MVNEPIERMSTAVELPRTGRARRFIGGALIALVVTVTTVPGVAAPAPQTTVTGLQYIDRDPIAQMPTRPVARPRPAPPKHPPHTTQVQAQQVANAPTARRLADLYAQVGRELQTVTQIDRQATIDLWARYRWVNFLDAIKTPAKRAAAAALLEKLLTETKKLRP